MPGTVKAPLQRDPKPSVEFFQLFQRHHDPDLAQIACLHVGSAVTLEPIDISLPSYIISPKMHACRRALLPLLVSILQCSWLSKWLHA